MTNSNEKRVEQRIREHYQASDGEWLVEKGKIKEARLLKEAVERIDTLRDYEKKYWAEVFRRQEKDEIKRNELEAREQKIKTRELELEKRLSEIKQKLSIIDFI
jgi:hypothetical protein